MDPALTSASPGYRWLDVTLSLQSTTKANSATFACHGSVTVEDLVRLADLIEAHVRQLPVPQPKWAPIDASASPSLTWMTDETPIQIQCLAGEAAVENGTLVGEFSIRIMLKLGKNTIAHNSVYSGFEGTIDVKQAIAFCATVKDWAAHV